MTSHPPQKPGKFIVLEGVEGAGKTTQLARLAHWLTTDPWLQPWREQGELGPVITTREPGGTPLGKELRALLLDNDQPWAIDSRAELLLYAADRAQHVDQVIRPALAAGQWVLCDRFVDSTVAYQGHGRGLDMALIDQLNHVATAGLTSDVTLWLQVPIQMGLARSQRRGTLDRIEAAEAGFHQRVQQGFEALALAHPQRIVPVTAGAEEEAVAQQIQQILQQRLQAWYPLKS